jgi:di/tricarboxylate transporter
MTGEAVFVCCVLAMTIILFVSDRVRLDLVALGVIVVLAVSGVLTPREAVAGFGDTVVVLIAGLFVVGEALSRTGVAAAIGAWLLRTAGDGATGLQVRLMLVVAVLSAFMSSTGAVAIFIPVAVGLARRTGLPAGRLLMPMAFAALLGGTLTLIGTPPNIVASGALQDAGLEGFEFASFTPVGLVLLAGGVLFLTTVGRRLLPTAAEDDGAAVGDESTMDQLLARYGLAERVMLLVVGAGSPLIGQSLAASDLRTRTGFAVLAVQRRRRFHGKDVFLADRNTVLQAGDILLTLTPLGARSPSLPAGQGLAVLDRDAMSEAVDNVIGLAEVVVAPRSEQCGRTIAELENRRRRRLHLLGLQHHGENIQEGLLDHEMAMGDTMLVAGAWQDIDRLRESSDFLVMALPREWRDVVPAFRRAPVALAVIAAMMLVMVAGALPAVVAVLAAGLVLVATGCVSMPQAYRAVNWQSLVLIAGMLPMGTALAKTGALDAGVARLVDALGGVGPLGLMAALFMLTAVLSQVISNTATTVLLAPVAIGVAEGLGVSARPLVMAVAMAASAAFVTPVASPVNTLVLGPGGYRFADFVKVGLPLLVLVMALVLLVVPVFFPF